VLLLLISGSALLLPGLSAQQTPAPYQRPTPGASQPAPEQVPLSQTVYSTADDADYREDFASLSLQGSAFFPLPPFMGQEDNNPKLPFIRQRWQMMWRPADSIDLFVCKPRGATGKLPVILYLYSSPSSTDRFKSDDWCMTMTADGFAAVGFVSAYTGQRLSMRSPAATFFTDFQESIVSTVHDVQLILNYLATRDDMDMTRVGMYAQGSGGTIAILASSVDKRIQAIDVLTPWGDWPNFFAQSRYVSTEKRAKFLAPEYQAKIAPFDPVKVLPNVQARSVRIQDVRKSGPMPDASQERLEAAAPPTAVINQYGDPASLAAHAPLGVMFSWLRTELQSNAQPKVAVAKSERIHYFPPESVNPLPPLLPLAELQKQDQEKKEQQQKNEQQQKQPPQTQP
jgi:hypothetical protein